jgi:hypothetical protein
VSRNSRIKGFPNVAEVEHLSRCAVLKLVRVGKTVDGHNGPSRSQWGLGCLLSSNPSLFRLRPYIGKWMCCTSTIPDTTALTGQCGYRVFAFT